MKKNMKIYKYLKNEVKEEINKEIKNKLNAEDVKAWQKAIADEYDSMMYDECSRWINSDSQYKEYEVGEDRIRELAEDFAANDIDKFINYCVNYDYDPYDVRTDEWIENNNSCCIFESDTMEWMIQEGYIIKK